MKQKIKLLLEDYERRLKTAKNEVAELERTSPGSEQHIRLHTKLNCYRTFVAELKRELK